MLRFRQSRSNMLTAIIHLVVFFSLKSTYEAMALARLPFVPISFVQAISHRDLPGTDPCDCGMIFIYALCSMTIKPNLQKLLGHDPPKTAVPAAVQKMAERWSGTAS